MRHHMPVTRCRARGTSVPDWDTCRPSGVFSKETGFGTDPVPYQVSLATALSSRPRCYRDWATDFRVVLSHLGTIVRWPWEDSVSGRTGLRQRWPLRGSARAVLPAITHTTAQDRGVAFCNTPRSISPAGNGAVKSRRAGGLSYLLFLPSPGKPPPMIFLTPLGLELAVSLSRPVVAA